MYELSLSLSRLYSAAQRDLYWLSQLGLQRMGWNPCNFCPRWTSVLIMHVVLTRVVRLHPETTKSYLTPTWFEHATFWSGVRRATVAPRSLHAGLRVWIALDHGTAHMNNYIVLCRRPLIKSVHQAIKSCTIRYVHYSMREKKCWPRGRPRFSSLFVSRPRWSSG